MEKQDLDNLQQITKDYAGASIWLSTVIISVVAIVIGYVMYFYFDNFNTLLIDAIIPLSFILIIGLSIASEYLDRALMRKSLGYVKQKEFFTSRRQKILWQTFFPMIVIIWFGIFPPFIKDKILLTNYYFLGIGFITLIAGLINQSKVAFYSGACLIIWAVICIWPLKHIFHAHEMAPWGIIYMTIGVKGIVSSFINYLQYRKIVQKIKGTPQ